MPDPTPFIFAPLAVLGIEVTAACSVLALAALFAPHPRPKNYTFTGPATITGAVDGKDTVLRLPEGTFTLQLKKPDKPE